MTTDEIVYAEVSIRFATIEELDEALPAGEILREELPYPAGFLAGKAYLSYRRQGGDKRSPIAAFYIGAHAAVCGYRLLTRDPSRYRTHFPKLAVDAPARPGRMSSVSAIDLTHRFRSTAGDVAWAAVGEPDADPVVLCHGTPFSSYVWRNIARALAPRHRVLVWDMPGYGASAMHEGQDVSLAAQGVVLTELLDHWGLSRPQVVAHDFGGAVALRAHLLHGARYRRLALVDPVALAPWGSPFFRLAREHTQVFRQLPPALHRALVREYVSSASARGLPTGTREALVAPWLGESGQPAFYRQIAAADQRYTDEVQGRYGQIDIPVLVCWGTADTWIPVAKAHELAQAIPSARLRLIDGAGHLVQEDAPAQLTAALVDFLTPG